jgi:small subunit ribosomal protein S12
MATLYQRLQEPAQRKKDNARTRILQKCPQARGWVNRLTIVTPRKPNSAKRPVIKVLLKRKGRLTAHIPGIGHTLKKFSKILVRGRGPRDLPGVRYSGVRGVLDFIGLKKKKRRRSIYGAEQNNLSKVRARRKYRIAIRKAEHERVSKNINEKILVQESSINTGIYILNKKQNVYVKILDTKIHNSTIFYRNSTIFLKNISIFTFFLTIKNYYIRLYNYIILYNAFYSYFFIFFFQN